MESPEDPEPEFFSEIVDQVYNLRRGHAAVSPDIDLGFFVKSGNQAFGVGVMTAIVMAFIRSALWLISISSKVLQIIGHILSVAWAIYGFNSIIFQGTTLLVIWLTFTVLVGMVMVFFQIAIPHFKSQMH